MKFVEFKEKLRDFIVFSVNDVRKFEADFDLRRLSEWQDKGYIKKVRREYYTFADLDLNEQGLFLIANKIYSPSYVSLEMAFSLYNLIPEAVYGITSVTSQKTHTFKTDFGEFIYRHMKPELIFGYKLVEYQNQNYKIAEIEKTVLDYFYLNSHLRVENDFSELRFNAEEFIERANRENLYRYLKEFKNKNLEKRIKGFLKYIQYA